MKITSVTIENFRNIEHAELALADSNFCIGHNEQGKSTIQNALQIALHGWCEHTDRRGAGYQALIRDGATTASVTAYIIHDDRTLTVTVTLGKKRDWCCTDSATGEILENIAAPADLWYALGIPAAEAALCMFPSQLAATPEFSATLSGHLMGGITVDDLAATMAAAHADYALALSAGHRLEMTSVQDYEDLGQYAYDKRRDLNRDLKLADATIEEIGFLKPVTINGARVTDATQMEAARTTETARLRELHTALGRAQAAEAAVRVDEAAVRDSIATQMEAIAEAEALLGAAEQYEAAQLAADAARDAVLAADRALTAAQNSAPAVCPTCATKLTAKKREAMTAEAVAAAEAAVAVAQARQTETAQVVDALERALPGNIQAADEIRARLTGYADDIRMDRRMLADIPAPYTGPTAADITAEIAAADARCAEIDTALAALQQHAQLDACKKQAAALREEIAHLQWIIEQYHEGRAIKRLLADAAGPLVARINAALPSGSVTLEADGKRFALLYDGRPVHLASRGRRAMVAYAIASAFAGCGAPVLLDDINDLDPKNRKALMTRLRAASGGTVIFAGTPLTPEIPLDVMATALQPMAVIHVDGGECRVIAAQEAAA